MNKITGFLIVHKGTSPDQCLRELRNTDEQGGYYDTRYEAEEYLSAPYASRIIERNNSEIMEVTVTFKPVEKP